MPDLADRLRQVESNPSPDLWDEIVARSVHRGSPSPSDGSRIVAGLVAAIIAIAGLGLLFVALTGNDDAPATETPPPIEVRVWWTTDPYDMHITASYQGEQIELDAIETPGSELEYPAGRFATLPVGTPFVIDAPDAEVGVFQLQPATGELVQNGSCLVPGALKVLPGPGEAAFFIHVEGSESSGGMAFRSDMTGDALEHDAAIDPDSTIEAETLGLEVCAPTDPTATSGVDRWSPATLPEGDRTVMPVTFPDGTTAELLLPTSLPLEEFTVSPSTYVDGGGDSNCGVSLMATRQDPFINIVDGEAPLAEYPVGDTVVGLWGAAPGFGGYDYLLFRFGSWNVLLPCRSADDADARSWAEHLSGFESPDGFLVLEGEGPLVANPYDGRDGPSIRMSAEDSVIEIRVSGDQCDTRGDRDARDDVVQWCIDPRSGIYVYALAFKPSARPLLEELVDQLDVRQVVPAVG